MEAPQVTEGAALRRSEDCGVHTVSLMRNGCDEYFITVPLSSGERPDSLFERAADALRDRSAAIVSMEIAGVPYGMGPLMRAFGPVAWPVTWIGRGPAPSVGGIRIWAIAGTAPVPIEEGGTVTAVRFEDPWATYCRAGGLVPANTDAAPADQAWSVLNAMEAALRAARLEFSDVVRTWFYNRDIAAWYRAFNRARNRFFDARGVFRRVVPASTGVGSGNLGAAALTAGLLAIRPKNGPPRIASAASPLQCPATNYGSAFSRAIDAAFPDHARLLISGTASISPHGQTEHPGDIEAQVGRTLEVVGALLESRGMSWDGVTDGLAYVKRIDDVPAVTKYLDRKQPGALPILIVHADICRDDLLFELEVNAISPQTLDNRGPADWRRRVIL